MLNELTPRQDKIVNRILDQGRDYGYDDIVEFSRDTFGAPDEVFFKAHALLFKYLKGDVIHGR